MLDSDLTTVAIWTQVLTGTGFNNSFASGRVDACFLDLSYCITDAANIRLVLNHHAAPQLD